MHCILFIWAKPLVFSHLSVVLKSKCCTIPLNRYLCLTHILCMPFHHFLEHSNSVKKICKNAVQYVLHFKMKKVFPYFFKQCIESYHLLSYYTASHYALFSIYFHKV